MVFKFGASTEVKQSKKIEKSQQNAIRIICFKDRTEATNPLFKELKVMKMKNIFTYNNCLFVHDQINEKLQNNFAEYFMIVSKQHSYITRRSNYKSLKQ